MLVVVLSLRHLEVDQSVRLGERGGHAQLLVLLHAQADDCVRVDVASVRADEMLQQCNVRVVQHQVTIATDDARIGTLDEAILDAIDARLGGRKLSLEVSTEQLPNFVILVGLLEGCFVGEWES